MDHIIAENLGKMSRDSQRKKTLINLYYQEKQKQSQKNLAPKPAHPSQCHDLKDSRRFLNDAIMLVDRYMKQLTDESLMSRMQPKNRDGGDDGGDDNSSFGGPTETDFASVRVINDKLHDTLLEKDAWERRNMELDARAKGQNQAELSQMLSAVTRRRKKGFYGAARMLPEAMWLQAAVEKKSKAQRRQRGDDESVGHGDQGEGVGGDGGGGGNAGDEQRLDDDELDAMLFGQHQQQQDLFGNDDDDDDDGNENQQKDDEEEEDEIGAFLRMHNVFENVEPKKKTAEAKQKQLPMKTTVPAAAAAASSSLKTSAPTIFAGVDFSSVFRTDAFKSAVAVDAAAALSSSSSSSSLKQKLEELERRAAAGQTQSAASPLIAPGGAWDLGNIPTEAEMQRIVLENRKARLRAKLQQA